MCNLELFSKIWSHLLLHQIRIIIKITTGSNNSLVLNPVWIAVPPLRLISTTVGNKVLIVGLINPAEPLDPVEVVSSIELVELVTTYSVGSVD